MVTKRQAGSDNGGAQKAATHSGTRSGVVPGANAGANGMPGFDAWNGAFMQSAFETAEASTRFALGWQNELLAFVMRRMLNDAEFLREMTHCNGDAEKTRALQQDWFHRMIGDYAAEPARLMELARDAVPAQHDGGKDGSGASGDG